MVSRREALMEAVSFARCELLCMSDLGIVDGHGSEGYM
jgi:hypothetical protein